MRRSGGFTRVKSNDIDESLFGTRHGGEWGSVAWSFGGTALMLSTFLHHGRLLRHRHVRYSHLLQDENEDDEEELDVKSPEPDVTYIQVRFCIIMPCLFKDIK